MQKINQKLIQKNIQFKLNQTISSNSTELKLSNTRDKATINLAHVQGSRRYRGAFMYMNKRSSGNVLSPMMIDELHRHLDSYRVNDNVKMVYIDSIGEDFSVGHDMKLIYELIMRKQHEKAIEYLKSLNELGLYVGQYNKPVITNIRGEMSNAAASIFSQLPNAQVNECSRFSLHESDFNLVSDCGASYYLSRMEHEVGLYLILTGQPINYHDILKLQLAYSKNHQQIYDKLQQEQDIIEQLSFYKPLMRFDQLYPDPTFQAHTFKEEGQFILDNSILLEAQDRLNYTNENAKLVLSEMEYKKQMAYYSNSRHQQSYNRFQDVKSNNHLLHFQQNVIDELSDQRYMDLINSNMIFQNLDSHKIGRCFKGNSIEEIIDNLQREGDQWSLDTIQQIKSKSSLIQKIILKLIREAENKQWHECYEIEFRINQKLLKNKETVNIMEEKLRNNKSQDKRRGFDEVSMEEVEEYFMKEDKEIKLNHRIVKDALLPVKDYYQKYPDSVRFYLNEQSQDDFEQRKGSEQEVRGWLMKHQINVENVGIDTKIIRQSFYNREQLLRKINTQKQKILLLIESPDNLKHFKKEREKFIEQFFEKDREQWLEQIVNSVFDEYYTDKHKQQLKLNSSIQFRHKKLFFNNIKLTAFKHRLTSTQTLTNFKISNSFIPPSLKSRTHTKLNKIQSNPKQTHHSYIVTQDQLIFKKRKKFAQTYLNDYGLEKDFIHDYAKKLTEKQSAKMNQEQQAQLQENIKNQIKFEIKTNLNNILEKLAFHEENRKNLNQQREAKQQQINTDLKNLNEILETAEKQRKNIVKNDNQLQSLLNNNQEFKISISEIINKSQIKAVQIVQNQLMNLLEEIVDQKSKKIKTNKFQQQVSGNEMKFLNKLTNQNQQCQKEKTLLNSSGFAFGYLGVLYSEQIYYKLKNLGIDLTTEGLEELENEKQTLNLINKECDYGFESIQQIQEFITAMSKISAQLAQLYLSHKDKLLLSEDKLVELLIDFNHLNQLESKPELWMMNPHNQILQQNMINVQNVNQTITSKQDIPLSEYDLVDNTFLDDEYNENYIKVEEEQDIQNKIKHFQYSDIERSKRMFLKKNIFNHKSRYLIESSFNYIRKLDRLQQKLTLGEMECLPNELQFEEEIKMPKNFKFDLRESVEEWLENSLRKIIRDIFDIRLANEKTFSRHQLQMLDLDINQLFSQSSIKQLLKNHLHSQMAQITLFQDVYDFYKKGGKLSRIHQFTNKIQNENKQFQLLAFKMSQQFKHEELIAKAQADKFDSQQYDDISQQINSFTNQMTDIYEDEINNVEFNIQEQEQNDILNYEQKQDELIKNLINYKKSVGQSIDEINSNENFKLVQSKVKGIFKNDIVIALNKVRQEEKIGRIKQQLDSQILKFIQDMKQQQVNI